MNDPIMSPAGTLQHRPPSAIPRREAAEPGAPAAPPARNPAAGARADFAAAFPREGARGPAEPRPRGPEPDARGGNDATPDPAGVPLRLSPPPAAGDRSLEARVNVDPPTPGDTPPRLDIAEQPTVIAVPGDARQSPAAPPPERDMAGAMDAARPADPIASAAPARVEPSPDAVPTPHARHGFAAQAGEPASNNPQPPAARRDSIEPRAPATQPDGASAGADDLAASPIDGGRPGSRGGTTAAAGAVTVAGSGGPALREGPSASVDGTAAGDRALLPDMMPIEIRTGPSRGVIGAGGGNRIDLRSDAPASDRTIPGRSGAVPDALPAEFDDPALPLPRPRLTPEAHRAAPRSGPTTDATSVASRPAAAGDAPGAVAAGLAAGSPSPQVSPMMAAMPLAAGPGLAETLAATRQIAGAIAADPGVSQIDLRLDPPELGRVEIRLDFLDDTLRAIVSAERSATADLLRRHGEGLIQQLREAGFAQIDLGFGQFAGDARNGSGRSADPGHRIPAPDAGRAAGAHPGTHAHPFHGLRSPGYRSDQALDLKV